MPNHVYRRAYASSDVTGALSDAPSDLASEELLDAIEYRFRLSGLGPRPLSVDGARIGQGLPTRLIPLPELASVLMHPSCGYAARDAVWRLLVANARSGDERWVVGAVGVALPGLR